MPSVSTWRAAFGPLKGGKGKYGLVHDIFGPEKPQHLRQEALKRQCAKCAVVARCVTRMYVRGSTGARKKTEERTILTGEKAKGVGRTKAGYREPDVSMRPSTRARATLEFGSPNLVDARLAYSIGNIFIALIKAMSSKMRQQSFTTG